MSYSKNDSEAPQDPKVIPLIEQTAHRIATELTLRSILLKINSVKANELLLNQLKEQSLTVTTHLGDTVVDAISEHLAMEHIEMSIDEKTHILCQYSEIQDKTASILEGIFSPPNDIAGIC